MAKLSDLEPLNLAWLRREAAEHRLSEDDMAFGLYQNILRGRAAFHESPPAERGNPTMIELLDRHIRALRYFDYRPRIAAVPPLRLDNAAQPD